MNLTATVPASPPGIRDARLAVVLGALTALAPLTVDLYLPALPEIADQLNTSDNAVQWTLTGTLIGIAIGQLLIGPLADKFGRRRPVIAAMTLHTLMSVMCALAPTIGLLIAARTLQGVGAAAGGVVALAIIRDLYTGLSAARMLARMMLITGVAPVIAPTLGGALLRATNWHGLFFFLVGIGAALALLATLALPETHHVSARQTGGIGTSLRNYANLIRDRHFIGLCVAAGLAMTIILAYVSGSSFVLQQQFGLTPSMFAVVFGVNAVGLIAVAQLNPLLRRRFKAETVIRAALLVACASASVMVVLMTRAGGMWGLLVPLFVTIAMSGLVLPNLSALALALQGRNAGTAAALLGASQATLSAALSPLVGLGGTVTATKMAIVMLAAAAASLLVLAISTPRGTTVDEVPVQDS